jgi:hypothetical protein
MLLGGHEESRVGARQEAASLERALAWLPVASLLLSADGTALAVNPAWADLSRISEQDSLGYGWLDAVAQPERGALGASMRVAAALGEPGTAYCHIGTAVGGRATRWWWRPGPAGGLVVCVAGTGDGQAAPITQRTGITDYLASAVVHRLFGVGLLLQSACNDNDHPSAAQLHHAVDLLDDVIRDIRDAVFGEHRISPDG